MNTARIATTCLCIGLLFGCEAPAEQMDTEPGTETMMVADVAAETQAIRDVNSQWLAAVASKDATAAASFYTADGRLMAPNAPAAEGTAAVAETFSSLLAMPNVELSWTQDMVEVAQSGDLAYDIGTYSFAHDGPDGNRIEDTGKYIVVWKKVDGQWKVAADIFNTNLPAQ